jgi:hypothetical protein
MGAATKACAVSLKPSYSFNLLLQPVVLHGIQKLRSVINQQPFLWWVEMLVTCGLKKIQKIFCKHCIIQIWRILLLSPTAISVSSDESPPHKSFLTLAVPVYTFIKFRFLFKALPFNLSVILSMIKQSCLRMTPSIG